VNICFTSHRYHPLIGGYDNQIRQLAEHLSKHHHVTVVTYNLTGSPTQETLNSVEVHRVKPNLIFFRVPLSAGYLKKIGSQNFDLLHAHGFVPVVSDLSVAYAKSKGKATVYTHHFDGNVQDATAWNTLANLYNRTIARQSLHYADAIVATTKSYAETSPILKPILNRVQLIPCFVDCEQFKPAAPEKVEALRSQLGLGNRKTVLFVGRIVPYKGIEYLIEALEVAKVEGEELNLLLLGGGEGKSITNPSLYYQKIQSLAQNSPVSKKIHFSGRVENNQLSAYYSLADVVALPSVMRGEAFGAVLLESLACGTPIVASDIAGVKDVLKGNTAVGNYASPKDSYTLAKALIQVANRKADCTSQCREFAVSNYETQKIVQDTFYHFSARQRIRWRRSQHPPATRTANCAWMRGPSSNNKKTAQRQVAYFNQLPNRNPKETTNSWQQPNRLFPCPQNQKAT
jgi:glycosyltransferase involved in cell wall biosynthesis